MRILRKVQDRKHGRVKPDEAAEDSMVACNRMRTICSSSFRLHDQLIQSSHTTALQ